jgi:hypothetical protein
MMRDQDRNTSLVSVVLVSTIAGRLAMKWIKDRILWTIGVRS